jgi:outer membrane lipoprotein LolB
MTSRFFAMAAGAMLLTACVAQPVRQALPPINGTPEANQATREARLASARDWNLQGRVALANGRNGGSGRIDWQQVGDHFDVGLSAPVTRQSWRLAGDRSAARLEGLDGGPREGVDAAGLLREATGWEIPVTALSAWVRGARAEGLGVARMQFGADGRLARIEQGGWTIDYSDWVPEPGLGIELPARLNAARDQAKVRLIVDAWSDGMAQP